MLNELLLPLREYFGFLNLFEYITFRAGASAILALLISFIFGPFVVKKLINLQIGESIRDHGPDSHKEKQGTPTMGGVLIILSTIFANLIGCAVSRNIPWCELGSSWEIKYSLIPRNPIAPCGSAI